MAKSPSRTKKNDKFKSKHDGLSRKDWARTKRLVKLKKRQPDNMKDIKKLAKKLKK